MILKTNFSLVVGNMVNQFQDLYTSYGYGPGSYKGYEIIGGGYSGSGSNYDLHVFPIESILSDCIRDFYIQNKDWKHLSSFIFSECNKSNPVFIKRSFIPFLLNQFIKFQKDNRFYKALVYILKIERGLPSTEDILINELHSIHSKIKDCYLDKLLKIILYKYSEEGINSSIMTIQFLFRLIESGKLNFKAYLKGMFLNEAFKNNYRIYVQSLRLFESRMENKYIRDFFNEIKDKIDFDKF